MLQVAALMFAISCVALLSMAAQPRPLGGAAAALAAAAASTIAHFGVLSGLLVLAVLLLASASVLVLILAPRPALAHPLAGVSFVLGTLSCAAVAV